MNLVTLKRQIVRKYLAIYVCQITGKDLAIKEAKLLAIKMTLVHVIQQCW
jgi:hypothetical protein